MTSGAVHAESTLAGALAFEASCVSVGEAGVLLLGSPGCGKSDLALRLVDRGAFLVSDGSVNVYGDNGLLMAAPPPSRAGKLSLHGMPDVALPVMSPVVLRLAVHLSAEPEKLALPEHFECLGKKLPLMAVNPAENSADVRVRAMVWNLNLNPPDDEAH